MGDLGDSWREHKDYKRKLKYHVERACEQCGRVQSIDTPRCIRCGEIDWLRKKGV